MVSGNYIIARARVCLSVCARVQTHTLQTHTHTRKPVSSVQIQSVRVQMWSDLSYSVIKIALLQENVFCTCLAE